MLVKGQGPLAYEEPCQDAGIQPQLTCPAHSALGLGCESLAVCLSFSGFSIEEGEGWSSLQWVSRNLGSCNH